MGHILHNTMIAGLWFLNTEAIARGPLTVGSSGLQVRYQNLGESHFFPHLQGGAQIQLLLPVHRG